MHESDHHRLVRSGNLSSKNLWETDSSDSVSERDASKLNASRVEPCRQHNASERRHFSVDRRQSLAVLDLTKDGSLYASAAHEVAPGTALGH